MQCSFWNGRHFGNQLAVIPIVRRDLTDGKWFSAQHLFALGTDSTCVIVVKILLAAQNDIQGAVRFVIGRFTLVGSSQPRFGVMKFLALIRRTF